MRGSVVPVIVLAALLGAPGAGAAPIVMTPDPLNTGEPFIDLVDGKVDVSFTEVTLIEGETTPGGGSRLRFGFEAQWLERSSIDNLVVSVGPRPGCDPCILSASLENVWPEGIWRLEPWQGDTPIIQADLYPGWSEGLTENPRGELVYELAFVPSAGGMACDVCLLSSVSFLVPEPGVYALMATALLVFALRRELPQARRPTR